VLFEKILASRDTEAVQRQRLLMPLLVDLQPWQMAVFADIADELDKNGFEAEPFGPEPWPSRPRRSVWRAASWSGCWRK
jgi:DNA mismatch repair protein MutL